MDVFALLCVFVFFFFFFFFFSLFHDVRLFCLRFSDQERGILMYFCFCVLCAIDSTWIFRDNVMLRVYVYVCAYVLLTPGWVV